jgi:hypothetical protein
MFHRAVVAASLGLFIAFSNPAHADEVTPAGLALAERIDALDVEHRWIAGAHVTWETGLPDGRPELYEGKHTHCSAFAAAAARTLGIYILRPPQHSQSLLANAQYDWLASQGPAYGWQSVPDGLEAQKDANQGQFVVVVYHNHHDDKPGHIAVVRPSDKNADAIAAEGPQITQAGASNYRSTTVRAGFSHHPGAWENGEVRYYAHAVGAASAR